MTSREKTAISSAQNRDRLTSPLIQNASAPQEKLNSLVPLMRLASELCRSIQLEIDQLQSVTKSDKSPVTIADFAAQALIASHLERIDGAPLRLVGEESSEALLRDERLAKEVLRACERVWPEVTEATMIRALELGAHDASGERYWTLDPIDGTKGFLRGQQFAISLALIEEGSVILGALACPKLSPDRDVSLVEPSASGTIYLAARGAGASVITDTARSASPVRVGGHRAGVVRLCESVEAAHSDHDQSARILEKIADEKRSVRLDSQCKYAVVARGQADLYLRMPTRPGYVEKIWDHAAGALIATEAGAKVSDIYGKPLDFSHGKGLAQNQGVLCAHPAIYEETLHAISALSLTPSLE